MILSLVGLNAEAQDKPTTKIPEDVKLVDDLDASKEVKKEQADLTVTTVKPDPKKEDDLFTKLIKDGKSLYLLEDTKIKEGSRVGTGSFKLYSGEESDHQKKPGKTKKFSSLSKAQKVQTELQSQSKQVVLESTNGSSPYILKIIETKDAQHGPFVSQFKDKVGTTYFLKVDEAGKVKVYDQNGSVVNELNSVEMKMNPEKLSIDQIISLPESSELKTDFYTLFASKMKTKEGLKLPDLSENKLPLTVTPPINCDDVEKKSELYKAENDLLSGETVHFNLNKNENIAVGKVFSNDKKTHPIGTKVENNVEANHVIYVKNKNNQKDPTAYEVIHLPIFIGDEKDKYKKNLSTYEKLNVLVKNGEKYEIGSDYTLFYPLKPFPKTAEEIYCFFEKGAVGKREVIEVKDKDKEVVTIEPSVSGPKDDEKIIVAPVKKKCDLSSVSFSGKTQIILNRIMKNSNSLVNSEEYSKWNACSKNANEDSFTWKNAEKVYAMKKMYSNPSKLKCSLGDPTVDVCENEAEYAIYANIGNGRFGPNTKAYISKLSCDERWQILENIRILRNLEDIANSKYLKLAIRKQCSLKQFSCKDSDILKDIKNACVRETQSTSQNSKGTTNEVIQAPDTTPSGGSGTLTNDPYWWKNND